MKKKIIGIFVCGLVIAVAVLPVTGAANVKTIWNVNENNYSKPYQNTPAKSPDLITVKIVAEVVNVSDPYNLLGDTIHKNDVITGKYTYDTATPDTEPDPTIGEYIYNSSLCGWNIKAGGFIFKSDPSSIEPFYYYIGNDFVSGNFSGDGVEISSYNNPVLSNGLTVDWIFWGLYDTSGTAINSTDLPTTAPVLSDWEQSQSPGEGGILIIGHDPSDSNKVYQITADVTKATKSKTGDIYFITQPILIWLFEQFSNIFPVMRNFMKQ